MTNKLRTPKYIKLYHQYMKLYHSINSCTDPRQLATLKETVLRYYRDKKQGAAQLMAIFLVAENGFLVADSENNYLDDQNEEIYLTRDDGSEGMKNHNN